MSASEELDWPVKYPWNLLPRVGRHSFVPPTHEWPKNPKRGRQFGYADATGNEWIPAPGANPESFHWDVMHRGGGHSNVRPDGEIHHGPDNF
jgi:hypothetical protein